MHYSELGGSIDISTFACPSASGTAAVTPIFALFRPGLLDPLLPVVLLAPPLATVEAATFTF